MTNAQPVGPFSDPVESKNLALEGLSTLAAVAAGIAHEVNNPLAYVLTNLDFVREQLGDKCTPDVVAALEEARLGAVRIGEIVRNLQIVVTDEARIADLDLGDVVESACMIVQSEVTVGAKILRERAWAPRISGNAPRVAYAVLKMLMLVARGTNRLERSTLRVSTGADENGVAVVEIEGFSELSDLAAIEHAIENQGLDVLAAALSAHLTAEFRAGFTVLRLAFASTTRHSTY
jgi:signal transduction histidine kinase